MRVGRGRQLNMVLLSLALALLLSFGVSAGEERGSGSVTVQLPAQGNGVELTAYQVASFDGGYFTFADAFAGSGLENMDLNDSAQVEQTIATLEAVIANGRIAGTAGTADASGSAVLSNLPLGLYLIRQTGGQDRLLVQPVLVPLPYAASDGSGWIYDVVLSPKNSFPGGAAILNKVDDEGDVVGGVQFALQEKVYSNTPAAGAETGSDANGAYYWREFKANLVTDENGQIVITGLPVGTYRFIETDAPEGLIFTDEPYEFTISRAGETAQINGRYARSSGEVVELTVENRQTRLEVDKLDENGELLAGATLVIKDALGNAIHDENGESKYMFTTQGVTFALKRIAPGSYLLSEVQAPEGYQIAEDVAFEITGDELEPVKVTMTDKKIPKRNQNSLTVTKHLMLTGLEDDLLAQDVSFYVALFSDAERTHRVSDVKEIKFHNSAVNSVTFENLGAGTYYAGETNAEGVALNSGLIDDVIFAPEYNSEAEFTFEGRSGEGATEIRNMFMDIPTGYYVSGQLTVTKKVLLGGEPHKSDDTFYARVFKNAELTEPLNEYVIEIPMGGEDEASVTVYDLPIGETIDSSATYYVAETDEKGNPIDPDSVTEYTISVDHSEFTLNAQNSHQQVTITNDFVPESEETEAKRGPGREEETEPFVSVSGGTKTPKTGDDTDLRRYLILMALSAGVCAGCAGLYARRRRKDRRK